MRLPETGKRKYGLEMLKGRNLLCHVHSLAFLVGAVRGLDDKLLHEREAWCSSPAMTVMVSMTGYLPHQLMFQYLSFFLKTGLSHPGFSGLGQVNGSQHWKGNERLTKKNCEHYEVTHPVDYQ